MFYFSMIMDVPFATLLLTTVPFGYYNGCSFCYLIACRCSIRINKSCSFCNPFAGGCSFCYLNDRRCSWRMLASCLRSQPASGLTPASRSSKGPIHKEFVLYSWKSFSHGNVMHAITSKLCLIREKRRKYG